MGYIVIYLQSKRKIILDIGQKGSIFLGWFEIKPAHSDHFSYCFKKRPVYDIFDHPSPGKKDLAYMLRKNINTRCASLVLAGLFLACSADIGHSGQPGNPAGVKKGASGIAVTPKHFPEHTIADVKEAFQLARTLGNHTVFIYQWQHLDVKIAELMLTWSRNAGMTSILGLSPTTLDQDRKELDLPADIRRKAGPVISFANPVIRQGFKQVAYIRRLPALLEQVNVSVVAWALLHDIQLPQFDADLNSVGLITTAGRKKPGFLEFKALRNHLR
jgi:hypothetical protein